MRNGVRKGGGWQSKMEMSSDVEQQLTDRDKRLLLHCGKEHGQSKQKHDDRTGIATPEEGIAPIA